MYIRTYVRTYERTYVRTYICGYIRVLPIVSRCQHSFLFTLTTNDRYSLGSSLLSRTRSTHKVAFESLIFVLLLLDTLLIRIDQSVSDNRITVSFYQPTTELRVILRLLIKLRRISLYTFIVNTSRVILKTFIRVFSK